MQLESHRVAWGLYFSPSVRPAGTWNKTKKTWWEPPDTARSYCNIGATQHQLGDYTSALQSHQRALEIWRERLGNRHPYIAYRLKYIGNTEGALGDYTSAFQSHQEALEIGREKLGENHPDTADIYHSLGKTQYHLKQFSAALLSHHYAYKIRCKIVGQNHSVTAASLHKIERTQLAALESALELDGLHKQSCFISDFRVLLY